MKGIQRRKWERLAHAAVSANKIELSIDDDSAFFFFHAIISHYEGGNNDIYMHINGGVDRSRRIGYSGNDATNDGLVLNGNFGGAFIEGIIVCNKNPSDKRIFVSYTSAHQADGMFCGVLTRNGYNKLEKIEIIPGTNVSLYSTAYLDLYRGGI